MPANDTTPSAAARLASSPKVQDKAAQLAARYVGRGRFVVASGSEPGRVYEVQAPRGQRDCGHWDCDCAWSHHGGRLCSHVQAAARELARLDRRKARRRAEEDRLWAELWADLGDRSA